MGVRTPLSWEAAMVQAIHDQWLMAVAAIVVAAIAVWLVVDRWIARGRRRGP